MSSRREQLENTLATSFARGARIAWADTLDTLAVYADELQSLDDPRGELIALDLLIEQRGTTTELVARRASLLAAWLGAFRPVDNPHHAWVGDSFRLGFIDNLEIDSRDANILERLPAILAGPAGPYLRGITLRGDEMHLERALLVLATRHHAWLERLAIVNTGWAGRPITAGTVDGIIVATPRLAELAVTGNHVLAAFAHPNVTRLEVTGTTALGSLADGPEQPAVVELDLMFDAQGYAGDPEIDYEPPPEDEAPDEAPPDEAPAAPTIDLATFLTPARFPALRRLDLSRNEPAVPTTPNHVVDGMTMFTLLGRLAIRRQLTWAKLPSLRAPRDAKDLQRTLADMPELAELAIVRAHQFAPPELVHARAKVVVDRSKWPWPPAYEQRGGQGLRVTIPGARSADVVSLRHAVTAMEWRWASFPADARAAWTKLWAFLEALSDDGAPFPLDTLVTAIESCGASLDEGGWRELLEDMRDRRTGPGASVRIERCIA